MGCHALLQGIFLTEGSNLCHPWLLAWQTDSFPLSPRESPLPAITSQVSTCSRVCGRLSWGRGQSCGVRTLQHVSVLHPGLTGFPARGLGRAEGSPAAGILTVGGHHSVWAQLCACPLPPGHRPHWFFSTTLPDPSFCSFQGLS